MIVLDTNVLIEIFKDNQSTLEKVHSFNYPLAISSITVMELFYGALNKTEVKKLEKFVALFEIIDINETISKQSTTLIRTYAKSHKLDIPDGLIASTALVLDTPLFTYNLKDFRFIDGLLLEDIIRGDNNEKTR